MRLDAVGLRAGPAPGRDWSADTELHRSNMPPVAAHVGRRRDRAGRAQVPRRTGSSAASCARLGGVRGAYQGSIGSKSRWSRTAGRRSELGIERLAALDVERAERDVVDAVRAFVLRPVPALIHSISSILPPSGSATYDSIAWVLFGGRSGRVARLHEAGGPTLADEPVVEVGLVSHVDADLADPQLAPSDPLGHRRHRGVQHLDQLQAAEADRGRVAAASMTTWALATSRPARASSPGSGPVYRTRPR